MQEEPLSLCTKQEGRQGFPWLFVRPSRFLFAQKEGWNVPGYPRWARAWALPVSCYRVVRVEARTPFAKGRLAVRRRTPRVPEGFSSGCRGRSLGLGGSVPPYGGIPFRDLPIGLGHNTGRARTGSPVVVPDSVVLGRLSKPPRGPAFEPLDRNRLRAWFLHLKGIGRGE